MRILLLGEYSNVHNTLAQGLRAIGHEVCVASGGDSWKNYPRDIDLQRKEGVMGNISFLLRLLKALPKMRGYDVVQIINPVFLELKANRIRPIYDYLRRHNKKVVMGAFGMDYYWVSVNDNEKPLRYSDFNIGDTLRHDAAAEKERRDWVGTDKQVLNEYIAYDCDGIVSGLYEYDVVYKAFDKMQFIPFPIVLPDKPIIKRDLQQPLRIFVGISKGRSAYKGTDIMFSAAQKLKEDYPDKVELLVAEGVPFTKYQTMMRSADCILDQLYAYTPAMNALLAMSQGIINVGGGEPENYEILGEKELRPIVNVQPTFQSVYDELQQLVLHPERIKQMRLDSIEYVRRHHDYIKVAGQYECFYNNLL